MALILQVVSWRVVLRNHTALFIAGIRSTRSSGLQSHSFGDLLVFQGVAESRSMQIPHHQLKSTGSKEKWRGDKENDAYWAQGMRISGIPQEEQNDKGEDEKREDASGRRNVKDKRKFGRSNINGRKIAGKRPSYEYGREWSQLCWKSINKGIDNGLKGPKENGPIRKSKWFEMVGSQ